MTPRSILVVDDEPPIRELVRLNLERAGHSVACAEDGRRASQAVREKAIDLVITDLLMPDRDGLELIAELRRTHPAIRIIAMSGGGKIAREQYLHLAEDLGAHKLLPKPFSSEQLMAAIEEVLPPTRGLSEGGPAIP